MAKNKIITSQGNVQFINSKGKIINMHPMHCYAVYENDTVSFLFVYMKDYSGQAFFTSQYEDLEVNGETYDNIDDLRDAITYAFAKAGAQARTEIVDELPEDPFTNTIYLVAKQHGEGYDEYIWNEDGGWQLIGDTDIEFERYLQIADFNPYSAATKDYIDLVSGNTVQNAADIVSLSGAIDTEVAAREAADAYISGAVDTNTADIASEASRAIAAETALGNRIDTVNSRVDAEQLARVQADTALSGAIDTEISNRESADTALQTAIDNEVSARTDADTALDNKISAVSGAVDTEVARAQSAETTLNAAINTEASARRNADDAILGKIDAVSGAVDTEITNRTDADTALQNAIDAEAAARVADVAALSGAVDTMGDDKADKASAVASAEYVSSSTTIDLKNISGEVISQVDASDFLIDGMVEDVRIENDYLIIDFNTASGIEDISIPLTDIFNPENYYDKDAVDAIVSGINDTIDSEIAVVEGEIDDLETALADEVSARTAADTALQTAIDNEVSARTSADAALQTAIDNEVSARTDADTALQSAIDTVSGNVETETSRAESAETALQTAINNEISARTAAIEAIEGEISGVSDSLSAYSTTIEMNAAIDAATSGKADSSDVYTKSEVDDAISAATDDMATQTWVGEQGYITGVDLSDYATIEYVDGAVSGKVDTTDFNTYSGNVETAINAKADPYSAGNGIDITNNVVSLDFPISAGTGVGSLLMSGSGNTASGDYSVAYGKLNTVAGTCGLVNGNRNTSNNFAEAAFGQMNISRTEDASSFGHSGNTIYTIGNGVINASGESKNHNAFEVRGNGDIYIADTNATGSYYDKPMIKLQDHLGGGGSTYTAGDGIDITNDVISVTGKVSTSDFNTYSANTQTEIYDLTENKASYIWVDAKLQTKTDNSVFEGFVSDFNTYSGTVESRLTEDEEVTASGLNALNDKFGGLQLVKISQSDYDNLQVKDNNTLYIISD